MSATAEQLANSYERDGFAFPLDVMSADEAGTVRADLEAAEAELADDPSRLSMLRSYPDRLLPSFDAMVRKPHVVDAVSRLLGPDLMVWSSGLFIKDANSTNIVTWHQDLTYWGLDDADELTVWVALSPATVESGCMRFVPGSHRHRQVAHTDTFDANNLLSRGQEVAVEVDESDAVDIVLRPGQASMHHGHLFHSSGPNRTGNRRIGAAVRYIRPSMKQQTGDRSLVALVAGTDDFGHFTVAGSPRGRLADEDFDLCRQDTEIKRRVLYAGAEARKGQRY
ncbi:MAG: phytanoyl-CoA dioxygenase family protein [Alphaproteobacteria bacterium]|nr:phytanoyl-CoA dioxygenase family protein [Alphaproteobacteria bacterium]